MGPVVGAAIGVLFQQTLVRYVGLNLIIQGLLLIGIILVMPRGVVGTLSSKSVRGRFFQRLYNR